VSFTGTYRHTLDAKGRLIVPARMREELPGGDVVLTAWFERTIAMWSLGRWEEQIEQRLLTERNSDPNFRAVVRGIASSAHQDAVDKQGRLVVPQSLRDWAAIDRDVVVTGALTHAELWNPDRWDEQATSFADGGLEELAKHVNF
jgi:MraZ protein